MDGFSKGPDGDLRVAVFIPRIRRTREHAIGQLNMSSRIGPVSLVVVNCFRTFVKVLFVIHRCLVTQCRMQTLRVVIHRHIFPRIGNGCLPRSIQLVTGPFTFQAAEEPFYRGIIPAVAFAAHTADHPMLIQQGLVGMTGIRAATIRVMDKAGPSSRNFGHFQPEIEHLKNTFIWGPVT
jgi:hypothetical protein